MGRAPSAHKHKHKHPQREQWPPVGSSRRRRRRTNTTLLSLGVVLLAVGCMAVGWYGVRAFTGQKRARIRDTAGQIAQADTRKEPATADTGKAPDTKAATPTPMPDPMAKPAPMPDPMAKPEPKPEAKPEAKPEPKPEAKPEPSKPEPKPPEGAATVFYDKDIKPIFLAKCLRCHGDGTAKPKGNFDMKTIAAIKKGGATGDPGLVPGNPDKSTIWTEIKDDDASMPPKGEPKLTAEEKKKVFEWIKSGAKESAAMADAAPAPAGKPALVVSYEKHVLPILKANCFKCHSGDQPKNDFSVLTLAALKKGGSSGKPGVVPGDLKKSHMWEMIAKGDMPPESEGFALEEKEKKTIKDWIEQGAKDDKEAMVAAK